MDYYGWHGKDRLCYRCGSVVPPGYMGTHDEFHASIGNIASTAARAESEAAMFTRPIG